MYAEVEKQKIPAALQPLMPDELQAVTVMAAFSKYKEAHARLLGHYNYTMPPEPLTDAELDLLKMPLRQWLRVNHLEAMTPFLAFAQTAQGYGFLDVVPALYALYWLSPTLIQGEACYRNHVLNPTPALRFRLSV
jgi:hypothetical protein